MKSQATLVTALTILLSASTLMFKTPTHAYADTASTQETTTATVTPVSKSEYEANIKGVQVLNVDRYLAKAAQGEKFVVFIGFQDCSHCRNFSPIMKQYLQVTDHPVYYLDYGLEGSLKTASQSTREQFFATFSDPFEFMGTPTVALIKDGKVSSMTVGDDTTLADLQQLDMDYNLD